MVVVFTTLLRVVLFPSHVRNTLSPMQLYSVMVSVCRQAGRSVERILSVLPLEYHGGRGGGGRGGSES